MANALDVGRSGKKRLARADPKKQQERDRQRRLALRRRLNRETVCADPWADVILGVPKCDQSRRPEQVALARGIYPPGGECSLMRRCRRCRRWFPPQYLISSGHCRDCQAETRADWADRSAGNVLLRRAGTRAGAEERLPDGWVRSTILTADGPIEQIVADSAAVATAAG